jgi:uncharacterized protein (DUF342 family)
MRTEMLTSEKTGIELAEFIVEPFKDEIADKIINSISANKVFLTRLSGIELESFIVKESTPLFQFRPEEDFKDEEEEEKKKIILEVDTEFHSEESNIIQLGKEYIAAVDGLFVIANNIPRIIHVSLEGSCDVKVSEDSMEVIVDIYPSIRENSINTSEDIIGKITEMGVTAYVDQNLLSDCLKEVELNKKKFLDLTIVKGKDPIHGLDGTLENCTQKKEELKNLEFESFYRINPIISVKENEVIAIIHPPTDGEPGINIFGKRIPPIPGKPFNIKIGPNTILDEENGNHIIAKKDGFLNLSDQSISVTDTYTVRGDIDFKSGNIIAKGSLKVNGNVKNNFQLSLTKNIEIGGYLGGAQIYAGENVKVRGGFLGDGKGVIQSEGDVEVKFIENQKIFSRGSLIIKNDALNAQLFVLGDIICNGVGSSIVGRHAIAGKSIKVYNLGNDVRTSTIVEVGFDYLKRNSIIENKDKLRQLRTRLEEVDKNILELAKMKRMGSNNKERLQLLAAEHKSIIAEIDLLKEQNLKITSDIYIPTIAKVSVQGTVFPGVKIGINGRFLEINSIMKAKTFILSNDDEVIATHFDGR